MLASFSSCYMPSKGSQLIDPLIFIFQDSFQWMELGVQWQLEIEAGEFTIAHHLSLL